MIRALLTLALLSACLQSDVVVCEGGWVCSRGSVCDLAHHLCVTPEQSTGCLDKLDGDDCMADGTAGICDRGYCLAGCGNGIAERGQLGTTAVDEECDDGNRASRDGCSSSCISERLTWTQWTDAWRARLQHAAAYDSDRERLVIFGGVVGNAPSNEHWERVDAVVESEPWRQIEPTAVWPPARSEAVMAYDARRRRVVLFGGLDADGVTLADTWEYDGSVWHLVSPLASPPARRGAAMAYDPIRQRVVMFGGLDAASFGDTWEYDGATWVETTATGGPTVRRYPQMAWHPERERIVLFGGFGAGPPFFRSDTWEYDGAWSQPALTGASPPGRYLAMFGFAPGRNAVVLFGGVTPTGVAADTWEYKTGGWTAVNSGAVLPPGRFGGTLTGVDSGSVVLVGGTDGEARDDVWEYGGTWTSHPVVLSPPARVLPVFVYDEAQAESFAFGGLSAIVNRDTWYFDGTRWTARASGPVALYSAAGAYDSERGRVVVFGGASIDSKLVNGTHEWDGASQQWSTYTGTDAPSPRRGGAMAFVRELDALVLVGGAVGATTRTSVPTDETWTYDGETWKRLDVAPRPPAEEFPAAAYDPIEQRLVVYVRGETWQFSGGTWSRLELATSPPARAGTKLAFNAQRGRVWLYGGAAGTVLQGDAWELASDGWHQLELPATGPLPRREFGLVYDPSVRGLVVYGGQTPASVTGETWVLRFDSTTPDEDCDNGVDDDGDRRIDAEDPDC